MRYISKQQGIIKQTPNLHFEDSDIIVCLTLLFYMPVGG